MGDVAHVRPAGNNPDGFLSGRQVERHQQDLKSVAGRGWEAAPVPTDGRPHEWWPNRCTTCSEDPPALQVRRMSEEEWTRTVEALQEQLGGGLLPLHASPVALQLGPMIRPGIAHLLSRAEDLGGWDGVVAAATHLVAGWMATLGQSHEAAERRYADAEATIVELDTAKTRGLLLCDVEGGSLSCSLCDGEDFTYEYEGVRSHQVLRVGATRTAAGAPRLLVETRYDQLDGEERHARVRCRVCGELLALEDGAEVEYRPV